MYAPQPPTSSVFLKDTNLNKWHFLYACLRNCVCMNHSIWVEVRKHLGGVGLTFLSCEFRGPNSRLSSLVTRTFPIEKFHQSPKYSYFVCFCCCFESRSLCNLGCPGTHLFFLKCVLIIFLNLSFETGLTISLWSPGILELYVDQTGLKFRSLLPSASQVLELW